MDKINEDITRVEGRIAMNKAEYLKLQDEFKNCFKTGMF